MFAEVKPGPVTWEALKEELMNLPKETLVEMVSMWVKNYWTNQNYWMVCVERDFGFVEAARLDGEIWEHLATAQAHRLKKLLGLGDDVQSLAVVLKFTAPQWVTAGFAWEFLEIADKRLVMQINQCPMGTYRDSQGLELLPCKFGSDRLYRALARAVNPKFECTCLHAPPDPRIPGVMCRWEFVLNE